MPAEMHGPSSEQEEVESLATQMSTSSLQEEEGNNTVEMPEDRIAELKAKERKSDETIAKNNP